MGMRGAGRLWRRLGVGAIGTATVLLCLLFGRLANTDASLTIVLAVGMLLVALAMVDLTVVPVLAVPATLLMFRVGGFISVSDVVLAAATVIALLMISAREARSVQALLWAGAAYLAAALPTVFLNLYTANAVEWGHEVVLVLGSIVVGFVIGREGKARLALSLYALACSAIGVLALVQAALGLAQTGELSPVYLDDLMLHKNMIGSSLAIAVVILYARPAWIGWTRRWTWIGIAICGLGMLAAQSRQAIIGAVVGIAFISIRPHAEGSRRSRLIWLAAIPAAAYVAYEVNAQLQSENEFNSAFQRLTWYEESLGIWAESPLFGVGLRWWYTDRYDAGFQPPNAELEVLTSTGIFGLIGFLAMFFAALWVLHRLDPVYGTLGFAVVLTKFVQAQFDLYWVAGSASLLWIVAAMCYGAQARAQAGLPPVARFGVREPRVSVTP